MVAVPVALAAGVKVAVYTVALTAVQLLKAPEDSVTSPCTKSVLASLRVKVTVSLGWVLPLAPSVLVLARVMATVGVLVL